MHPLTPSARLAITAAGRALALALSSALCTALLAAGSAWAATTPANSDALARYQQERAACLNGQSNQDRATCLREAGAALAEAKRGALSSADANLTENQRKRCDRLSDDERSACMARMQGAGSTSGSVAGGGILRELKTTQPAAPAPPAASAPMGTPMPMPAPVKP